MFFCLLWRCDQLLGWHPELLFLAWSLLTAYGLLKLGRRVHAHLQACSLWASNTPTQDTKDLLKQSQWQSQESYWEKQKGSCSKATRLIKLCLYRHVKWEERGWLLQRLHTNRWFKRQEVAWFPEDHLSRYKRVCCFASVLLVPGIIIRQERGSKWLEELMNCSEIFPKHLGVLLLSY